MATETVQLWISRDMKLSKVITSFENDFSNGYLFGEILNRYQLIDDISAFSKKPTKEAKVKNFQQVETVLRRLKVKFDGKLVHQIMNEERGAALRLLFQMKLAIEKSEEASDPTRTGQLGLTMTGLPPTKVEKHLKEIEKIKDEAIPIYGSTKINRGDTLLAQSKPIINSFKYSGTVGLKDKMQIFDYRKRKLEEKALEDQLAEEALVRRLQQDARELEHAKMEENKDFMNQWLAEGKKNWQNNTKRRQDAIARVKYFDDREVQAYKNRLEKELTGATRELIGGINEFDQNLQKLGIEKNTNIEEAIKRMEEKKGIPPGQIQNFSYAATMNKIKEKKNVLDFAVKERDRRRRKMVVDQAKTQTELDRKRNEELLIEKLLKQQAEEHQFAYLERRGKECKELIVEQRRLKAIQFEEKKKSQIEQLERKRNEGMAEQIKKHKEDLEEKKREHQALRRDEKLKRRGVNVEICSEIADLIIDIANEAYDEQQKSQNGKLDKPLWREWMRYFKDNQLVSRARKGVLGQQQESAFALMGTTGEQSQFITEEQFDVLDDPKKSIEQVLDAMRYDPAYEDMLQYLAISGIFNITQGDFKEWFDIQKLLGQQQQLGIDVTIIDSLIPRQNPGLGKLLQQLLKPEIVSANASIEEIQKSTESSQLSVGIPHHLTLKLCLLGKACAGKRTVAKQIADQYPSGKVKVFRMDDLIKEVIEYINPKPVVDAATANDKGKKAPPAKGKVEDTGPIDPFAGLDTREYKEIGHQIKKFIGEGELPPAGTDLTALVTDEVLLISLFIQKLKLTFPHVQSDQAKTEEIKANMAKEKEILEQLQELEAANAAGGVDPKAAAAKGKAPPAKGGKGAGGPSGEEQLKADLELVTKVQPEGWILIDFPRNLSQAKSMERLMNNGYTCMVDRPKDAIQKEFELWSKFVAPASSISFGQEVDFNGQPYIFTSATDAYLFLDVPSEECIRRVSNRKIDPTTGTIYHPEDHPVPEGDAKLKDRLQDYQGDADQEPSRLTANHHLFDEQSPLIKRWASSFGLQDTATPMQSVSALLEVSVMNNNSSNEGHFSKPKKDEVFEMVHKAIGQIIAFKQAQYENKKQKIREQMEREAAVAHENHENNNHEQPHESEAQKHEGELHADPSKVDIKSSHNQTHYSKQSNQNVNQAFSLGGQSLNGFKRSQKQIIALNDEGKRQLWKQFESDYFKESLQIFRQIRRQRSQVFDGLTQMQASFIDLYLSRQDANQTIMIQDFVDSFNKFSEEFPNLRSDPQTQVELKKRLTRLSNDIWASVEQKKDQALAQHAKLNSDGWVVTEMKKLMKNAAHIIQCEIQKFFISTSIVTGYNDQTELDFEKVLENYSDDGVKTIDDSEQSPLFDKFLAYIFRLIQPKCDLINQLGDDSKREILRSELNVLIYRMNLIRTWTILKVKEFNQFWRQLYEVLDEAIITAIKLENEATQSVVKRIEEHMLEQYSTGRFIPMDYDEFRIPYIDLDQVIQRMDFSGAEVPLYMQSITVPDDPVLDMRLTSSMLEHFYKDFRFHAYEEFLDGQTFIHNILLAFQTQGRVPTRWRYYDFTIFNQMVQKLAVAPLGQQAEEVTNYNGNVSQNIEGSSGGFREFIDWKKTLTMFTLIMSPMPDQEKIEAYSQALLQVGEVLSAEEVTKVPAWFDDFEVITENPIAIAMSPTEGDEEEDEEETANRNRDLLRLTSIKQLLFKIHQTNTRVLKVKDYINSLREITELAAGFPNFHSFLFGE